MPRYQKFEELPAWQEAARLYDAVLDELETSGCPFSVGSRNQLDHAALSVSNNIAEGFERTTTAELLRFLGIARGSAGAVRSTMAVMANRPKMKLVTRDLARVRALAESCARQITAWTGAIEGGAVPGKRHLTPVARGAKAGGGQGDGIPAQLPEEPQAGTSVLQFSGGECGEGADSGGRAALVTSDFCKIHSPFRPEPLKMPR